MASPNKKKQKRRATTYRFTDELNDELARLAKLCGVSRNAYTQQYLWNNLIGEKQNKDTQLAE